MKYIALTPTDSAVKAAAEGLLSKINNAKSGEVVVMSSTESKMVRDGQIRLLEAPERRGRK